MSVHNIERKRKILETKLKSEEIINFYLIFLYILSLLWRFLSEELQCFVFANFTYCNGLFFSESRNWYGFTLAGYRNEKTATDPALLPSITLHFPRYSPEKTLKVTIKG